MRMDKVMVRRWPGEKPDTSDAIGRFDHDGNKVEEKCTDFGGYSVRKGSHQSVWIWRT